MINEITNKLYIKLAYIFISLSFATAISDFSWFNSLNKLILFVGLAYIGVNFLEVIFFRRRKFFYFEIFLYLFLVFTLLLNITQYKLNDNLKIWLVNLMITTVIFSIDTYKSKDKLLKELDIISYFYTFITSIISLISIIMIFTNKVITMDLATNNNTHIFETYKGLFKNENSFGIAAVISLMISLYLIYKAKNKYLKYFLGFNLIIQLISVFISGARSAYFPFLALIFIFLVYKFKNIYFRLSLIIIPSIVSIIGFFTLPANILHKILTSREYLWMSAIKMLKVYPLVGVGNVNKFGRLNDYRVAYLQGLEAGGLHNIFFEVACVNGIPAMILFSLFIIFMIVFLIKKLDSFSYEDKVKFSFMFALILGIILINLLESSLLYIISFISIIFWVYSGYLIAIFDKNKNH